MLLLLLRGSTGLFHRDDSLIEMLQPPDVCSTVDDLHSFEACSPMVAITSVVGEYLLLTTHEAEVDRVG